VKILPRLASSAPFLCLIVAHFEWPDMDYLGADLSLCGVAQPCEFSMFGWGFACGAGLAPIPANVCKVFETGWIDLDFWFGRMGVIWILMVFGGRVFVKLAGCG
jgi:hypothetical protein